MTSKLTASPEVVQTCREVVQTMTTDLNQTYVNGLTEGFKIGVLFMMLLLLFMCGWWFMNIFTDRHDRKIARFEQLQESSEVQS